MKTKSLTLVLIIVLLLFSSLKADSFKTPGEETNYTRYSQYEEITVFLSNASYLSKNIKIQILGQTNKTKNYTEKDLYLCIITEEGIDTVQEKKTYLSYYCLSAW